MFPVRQIVGKQFQRITFHSNNVLNKNMFRCYATQAQKNDEKQVKKPIYRFAVLLSGLGRQDGSDAIESVSIAASLLRDSDSDIRIQHYAADVEQDTVYNPVTDKHDPKFVRYTHRESARLSRGNIKNIDLLNVAQYDGLIMPSGKGYTRHYSTMDLDEVEFIEVNDAVDRVIQQFHTQQKWILAFGHSNALTGYILRNSTYAPIVASQDEKYASIMREIGCDVKLISHTEDLKNKLITSGSSYQENPDNFAIYENVETLVDDFKNKVKAERL